MYGFRRNPRRPSTLTRAVLAATGLALLLSACTSGSAKPGSSADSSSAPSSAAAPSHSDSPGPTTSAPAPPIRFSAAPAGRQGINPTTPITLAVANGTLRAVSLVNSDGKQVTGAMSADRKSWQATEVLGYDHTYRMTAKATNTLGEGSQTFQRSFSTLTPDNMTMPYLDTVYGSSIENGATYGVGMIPVVHFDEAIGDKKAAERALTVTTSPHVDGSWYWSTDSDAHWRPRNYYRPGTKVTINAKVYGVNVGNGMYGQADQSISYTIGAAHMAIANAKTHHVKVYFSGKLVRNMPTSMGRGGTTKGKDGQTIYLWTMPGTYTVIGHENPATMSSDSYGLPSNSTYGYPPEKVPYSTKISTDGIYLHELDTTIWAQGHDNVSHGCLNLNYDNASWYYRTSRVGDLVKVINSGGPSLQLWQGGDWTLSWAQWQQGSAL
ncbi:MAG: L,D-transpeptidase [Jatrophihabitantaceae bacterium]